MFTFRELASIGAEPPEECPGSSCFTMGCLDTACRPVFVELEEASSLALLKRDLKLALAV